MAFDKIEIEYTTSDRFGSDQHGDPHERHVQYVQGTIAGVTWGDDDFDNPTRTHLGTLSLAVVNLWEDGLDLFGALDSASSEWVRYSEIVEEEDEAEYLVILDRMEIAPEFRGHGIGLHVLARAVRTWAAHPITLVILTAFPTDGKKGAEAKAGGEALARYWARLGLERVETDGDSPILVGRRWLVADNDETDSLCEWAS